MLFNSPKLYPQEHPSPRSLSTKHQLHLANIWQIPVTGAPFQLGWLWTDLGSQVPGGTVRFY